MVPFVQKRLKKSLLKNKIPSISRSPCTIAVEKEYDVIIVVRCNGSMLRSVLVDGGTCVNMMTISTIKYIDHEIEINFYINVKVSNKIISKQQVTISNLCINVLGIFIVF